MIFNSVFDAGSIKAKIKVYASEKDLPTKADEGAIAIISGERIRNVYVQNFLPDDPSPNDLAIAYSSRGLLSANVGNVVIYPQKAYQYLDAEWVEVPMKVYSSGEWYDVVVDAVLYSYGDEAYDITGGWYASSAAEIEKEPDRMTFYWGAVSTALKVNLTHYSLLKVDVCCKSGNPTYVGIGRTPTSFVTYSTTGTNEPEAVTRVVNLEGITGEYYVLIESRSEGSPTYVYNVELIA